MTGKEKNDPDRPAVSKAERWLSLFLLGVLALIAAFMLIRQGRFDPGAWRQRSAPGVSAVRTPPKGIEDAATVAGLSPLSPAEHYDSRTLSDKINGKADLYLSAGFRSLESRRFSLQGQPNRWMERFVYDMGAVANAFAVYSAQRRGNSRPLGLTVYGYLAANGLFFVHGPYYVEIIAAEAASDVQAGMHALAADFVRTHQVAATRLPEIDLLPEPLRVADTIRLTARSAFGIEGLDGIFTAAYAGEQGQALAFVKKCASADHARALADQFNGFWIDFGGEPIDPPEDLNAARMVLILDNYEIVMVHENYLFGVHEATNRQLGLTLAERLREKIAGASR